MSVIRRANLDMFWSRESSTITGMFRIYEQAHKASESLGIQSSVHIQRKPWALEDKVGFGDAMVILWQSLQTGKNCLDHQQFESIRKIRSLAATMQQSRGRETVDGVSFKDGNRSYALVKSSTNSVFFAKFMKGCEKRMGRTIKQDAALSIDILVLVMKNLESELRKTGVRERRKRDIVMLGSFFVDRVL